ARLSAAAFQASETLVCDAAWTVNPAAVAGGLASSDRAVRLRASTWKLSPGTAREVWTTRNEIVSPARLAVYLTAGNARQALTGLMHAERCPATRPAGVISSSFRQTVRPTRPERT